MTVHCSTPDEAVRPITSDQRVFVHGASAFPQALIDALVRQADSLSDVEIVHLHTNGDAPDVREEYAGHFHHRALFVGPNVREAVDMGRATYVPIFLSDVPEIFRSRRLPLDAILLHLSPPDQHGFCSLGTSVDCTLAAAQAAPLRIAQINPHMPRTLGDSFLHVSELTHVVEVDEPLPEVHPPPPDEAQMAIGNHLADLVPDGATLQLGIGGIPDAALRALTGRKDLGIHSEMVSDGILDLVEQGVITGARALIGLAHPAFRDQLTRAARDLHLTAQPAPSETS